MIIIVVLVVGAALLVKRAQTRRVQDLAARLTECPARQIDVTREDSEVDTWRIDGCGITGVLRCDDTTAGCMVVPDGQ